MTTCTICTQECKPNDNGVGTGYGVDAQGREICYQCCANQDRAAMIEHGKYSGLYLTPNGSGWKVSNWPGSLIFPVVETRHSWHNFAGKNGRTDAWFHGPDGHVWHAVRIGDMDLCRVRRTKKLCAA